MKTDNTQLVSATDTFPYTSRAFHVGAVHLYAIQLMVLSGAVDVTLQGSCDAGTPNNSTSLDNVVNWTDIKGSFQSLVANDSLMYDCEALGVKWIRLVVVGSGSVSARINTKGV